jgi:hypothetical protein
MRKTIIKKRDKGIERKITRGWIDPTCTPMEVIKKL